MNSVEKDKKFNELYRLYDMIISYDNPNMEVGQIEYHNIAYNPYLNTTNGKFLVKIKDEGSLSISVIVTKNDNIFIKKICISNNIIGCVNTYDYYTSFDKVVKKILEISGYLGG
jgi:hypothetical protein